jgi:membrane protein DedA with SNARE-associated domain
VSADGEASDDRETAVTGHQLRTVLVFVGGLVVIRVIDGCLSSPSKEYADIALLVLALALVWFGLISIVLRRRAGGTALLELSDPSPSVRLFLLLLATAFLAAGVYLVYQAVAFAEPGEVFLDRLLTIVLCLSLAVVFIMAVLPGRARIRRRRRRRHLRSPSTNALPDNVGDEVTNP